MVFFDNHNNIVTLIIILLVIVVYSIISVLINKLHNVIHGKISVLAWVPVTDVYLLGKLVVNKVIGIILSILLVFGIIISFNIPGLESIKNIIPIDIVLPYQICYGVIIILLLLIGKSKYDRIIREGTGNDEMSRFIAKDYSEKEPVVTETPKPKEIKETIKDEYQYTHTSLSEVNHLNDKSDKNNP